VNLDIRSTRSIWISAPLALAAALSACEPQSADEASNGATESELASNNGLAMINGLSLTNGLSGNGLSGNGLSGNGLSGNGLLLNPLASTGLASNTGLMTTASGRTTVAYLVKCALPSGHSITKKDQNGVSYTFPGAIGAGAAWETGTCNTACQEGVSACMMAHVNAAGIHVPIWLDSPVSSIGYGSSSTYPNEEGTFFGNIFTTGSDGKVPAFYCEGSGFAKGIVPGRLGADASTIYRNPFGQGALCAAHCVAAVSPYTGQGYKSCNGYTSPMTVWRASSYRPDFDTSYYYKFINSQSGLAFDVKSWNTADNAQIEQYGYNGGGNQLFKIILTASSTWEMVNVFTGKAVTGPGTATGSGIVQQTFNNSKGQLWGIDDHNGHFKLINKLSGNAMEVPAGNKTAGTLAESSPYSGTANQDWDIVAVPQS
jgi:hypothetical protein